MCVCPCLSSVWWRVHCCAIEPCVCVSEIRFVCIVHSHVGAALCVRTESVQVQNNLYKLLPSTRTNMYPDVNKIRSSRHRASLSTAHGLCTEDERCWRRVEKGSPVRFGSPYVRGAILMWWLFATARSRMHMCGHIRSSRVFVCESRHSQARMARMRTVLLWFRVSVENGQR